MEWLQTNMKPLLLALGFAGVWAVIVNVWKKQLEKKMGFVGTSELSAEYDYVIVGGGTAGCLLANRLSEDPNCKVLLIEAGPTAIGNIGFRSPTFWAQTWFSVLDWNFCTTKQANLDDREIKLHRLKVYVSNKKKQEFNFK